MLPAVRFQLLFGPYRMPRCTIGRWLTCRLRGRVRVDAISDAPISWPMTRQTFDGRRRGGKPSVILCGTLVRAVRQESETAIAHHWRVGIDAVWKWRKALGVGPHTIGTRVLHREWIPERFDEEAIAKRVASTKLPERNAKIAAARRGKPRPPHVQAMLRTMQLGKRASKAMRKKLSEIHKRRGTLVPGIKVWTPAEDALLGTDMDKAVAQALGRTWSGVCTRRQRLGIPSWRLGTKPRRKRARRR